MEKYRWIEKEKQKSFFYMKRERHKVTKASLGSGVGWGNEWFCWKKNKQVNLGKEREKIAWVETTMENAWTN